MSIIHLLDNQALASVMIDLAAQSILISFLGICALIILRRKSAPVRSITATGTLFAMLGLFVFSTIFHFTDISWYKADVSRLKSEVSAVPAVAISTNDLLEEPSTGPMSMAPSVKIKQSKPSAISDRIETAVSQKTESIKFNIAIAIGMIGILWAGGTVFMLLKLGYGLVFIRGFRFGLKRVADEKISSILNITAQAFHKQRILLLYTSTTVESPITIGIIYPVIIIPEKLFGALSEDELKSILLHEQAHIYHCDHLMGVVKRLVAALNWWNPLVYRICSRHTMAREEVADNYVLKELNPRKYSECLAGLAEKICLISSLPSATGMAGNYLSLEQRVKNILSKKRKPSVNTGFVCKVSAMLLCGVSALLVAGCHLQISPEPATPKVEESTEDNKNKTLTGDYSISGTLPDEFPDRENAKGMVILSEAKGYPPVFSQEVHAKKGHFTFTLPANKLNAKRLKAKIVFKSELYVPLEAYCSVQPDKQITAEFRPLLKKQNAVHYYGECLDEITNKPIPYIGLYSDARGTEIGRADKNGHFDFYVEPAYGRTHVIPWLGSDKYVGRSHFFINKPGESAELKLVVECGVRLRVKTIDEQGNPIPGVKVTWFGAGSGSGTTDKTGNAHLAGMISRVRTGIIRVNKDGYELIDDPGPLTATLYTEKPLKLILRRVEASPPKDSKLTPRERARKRGSEDSNNYARAELLDIESIYSEVSRGQKGADMKDKVEHLIKKYPKANRTGCALLYLAQRSSEDEKDKYLEEAIKNYGDCYYFDGVQVGAYARYLLGISYLKQGKQDKVKELFDEIRTDYPDAVDHSGNNLPGRISLTLESTAKINREKQDAKVYSDQELNDINALYGKTVANWNNATGANNIEILISKYPKANKTGSAVLYFGQQSKADLQIKYLLQAIRDYSDCYAGIGVNVGAYARLLLSRIYYKQGRTNDALKLLEEIRTRYPDAIDDKSNNLATVIDLMHPEKSSVMESISGYWDKYKMWNALHDLQQKTGVMSETEKTTTDALMKGLTHNVYIARFKPVKDFNPVTPQQLLNMVRQYSGRRLQSGYGKIGTASALRTVEENNRLVGSFLTEEPQLFEAEINQNPFLKMVSIEKVTPESLIKYIASKQEYAWTQSQISGPKVIETIPANGAKDVDPELKFITVKFDRKMSPHSWAVCIIDHKKQLPVTGKPHFDKSSTVITIPVKLKPNQEYVTSLNLNDYLGFFSTDKIPLYPYRLSFSTGSGKTITE